MLANDRNSVKTTGRIRPPPLTGISDLLTPDGTFIHSRAAERMKILFDAQSSSSRGRHLSPAAIERAIKLLDQPVSDLVRGDIGETG